MTAETDLGLLGWQQADFDPVTQHEVDKIMNFERAQARLMNAGADLARTIGEVTAQRDEARKAFEKERAPIEGLRQATRAHLTRIESELAAARESLAELEHRVPVLERELREANRQYHDLLSVEEETPARRDERTRLRERTIVLPHEISEAQRDLARATSLIEAHQKTLAEEVAREAAIVHEERELEAAHAARDHELAEEIKAKEREKQRLAKEVDGLEREKSNPYLEIGRVLADSNVPPMNQPHALEAVRAARLRVQDVEFEMTKSHAESAREDRTLLQHSLILWTAILLALVLIIGALVEW